MGRLAGVRGMGTNHGPSQAPQTNAVVTATTRPPARCVTTTPYTKPGTATHRRLGKRPCRPRRGGCTGRPKPFHQAAA